MNHSDTSNPEDTSEKLEVKEEASEEPGGIEVPKEEGQKEVIELEEVPEKEEIEEAPQEEEPEEEEVLGGGKIEEPEEWTCDICETVYSNDDSYEISGYHEKICGQCYDRGLMWCIREAWKWRAQIRIDVLRKPKDE